MDYSRGFLILDFAFRCLHDRGYLKIQGRSNSGKIFFLIDKGRVKGPTQKGSEMKAKYLPTKQEVYVYEQMREQKLKNLKNSALNKQGQSNKKSR